MLQGRQNFTLALVVRDIFYKATKRVTAEYPGIWEIGKKDLSGSGSRQ